MPEQLRAALADHVVAHDGLDRGLATAIPGVTVIASTCPRLPFRKLYRPSLCVVAQGAKRVELTDRSLDYAEGSALVVSLEMPGQGSITRASKTEPFLGVTIDLDIALLREVQTQMPARPPREADPLGLMVEQLSPQTLDCITRMIRLLSTPEAIPVLAPALMRELCWWLLSGPGGAEVARLARSDGHAARIADAILLMRRDLGQPPSLAQMADAARMGLSSFHRHFRALTAMTPLQYLKQLRLIEARRLLVAEAESVTSAAFRVGYESPSQFSRDYSRMFGAAPRKDAMVLRRLAIPL